MGNNSILQNSKFCRAQGSVSTLIEGETVILHIETGKYCGLNEVGTLIWDTIEDATSFNDLVQKIMSEFDVTQDICSENLQTFLADMQSNNLIEVIVE